MINDFRKPSAVETMNDNGWDSYFANHNTDELKRVHIYHYVKQKENLCCANVWNYKLSILNDLLFYDIS